MKRKKLDLKAAAAARGVREKEWERRRRIRDNYRGGLEAEVKALPGGPVRDSLLDSAAGAFLEITLVSERLVRGRASQKSLQRAALARSELRRLLRALGLIADSGEQQRDDTSGPPPGATEQERREWSRRYVENALAEKESAAQ
jgi:hypothetical protein